MKIVAIANSLLAVPSIEALVANRMLAGLCTMEATEEHTQNLRLMASRQQIPLVVVNQKNHARKLVKWLKKLQPDVVFVLTYAYKISPAALSIPPLGFYNFHFGKLPQYRGPQTIFWEIRNQEAHGAISVHKMDAHFDHGALALVEPLPIDPSDTFGMYQVKLAFAAVGVVQKLLSLLTMSSGEPLLQEQDHAQVRYYARPQVQDLTIDWQGGDSHAIRAMVKASNPWNQGAFTSVRGINLRLLECTVVDGDSSASAGSIIQADVASGLVVQCCDGKALRIEIVRMEEGFLLGIKLLELGLKTGEEFTAPVSS